MERIFTWFMGVRVKQADPNRKPHNLRFEHFSASMLIIWSFRLMVECGEKFIRCRNSRNIRPADKRWRLFMSSWDSHLSSLFSSLMFFLINLFCWLKFLEEKLLMEIPSWPERTDQKDKTLNAWLDLLEGLLIWQSLLAAEMEAIMADWQVPPDR